MSWLLCDGVMWWFEDGDDAVTCDGGVVVVTGGAD